MTRDASSATDDDQPTNILDRAARSTIREESTAFGFSIMITTTFAAVQRQHGSPGAVDLMLFALAAVAAFTVLEGLASRGFRKPLPSHESTVATLGTAMNFVSVGLAALVALAVSDLVTSDAAWPIAAAAAVTAYLFAETVEIVIAETLQKRRRGVDATTVSE